MSLWYLATIAVVLGAVLWRLFKGSASQAKYPPGPKAHPFFGHALQVPTIQTWRYFERLSHQYGPIVGLSLAGDRIVVLNKAADAEELLGRRSHNYSSRKPLTYAGKYQSNDKRLVLLPYGEALKKQRAAFHQMLQPRVVGAYETIQELESLKFLHDMLKKPAESPRHTKRFSASLVFNLSYGKRLPDDGEDLDSVLAILDNFIRDTYPGAHLVDSLPILDKLPDFLAPWRAQARRKHDMEMEFYNRLVLEVKDKMKNGEMGLECFAARLWDQQEKTGLDLEEVSYVAGTAFEAGTDTTAGTIQWFLMAMVLYPQTMKRAQQEIDALLSGSDTIPGFAHINHLPYCVALTKEVFRWAPAAPGGFPHYSDANDEYKGYKIDGKTMVIPCIWSMHHDEEEFPNSYVFDPDRFMRSGIFAEHDSLTDGHYGFGFGRRKCPGQYMGAKSVWLAITRLLWLFDITPEHDTSGAAIPVDPNNCTSGMTSKPIDFPVHLSPRSLRMERLVEKEWALFH